MGPLQVYVLPGDARASPESALVAWLMLSGFVMAAWRGEMLFVGVVMALTVLGILGPVVLVHTYHYRHGVILLPFFAVQSAMGMVAILYAIRDAALMLYERRTVIRAVLRR